MTDRKRLWRIMQKPPIAYLIGGALMAIYATVFVSAPGAAVAVGGGVVLLSGWWFFERGATHKNRLKQREERIQQLEAN
jgi:hypothetical protein